MSLLSNSIRVITNISWDFVDSNSDYLIKERHVCSVGRKSYKEIEGQSFSDYAKPGDWMVFTFFSVFNGRIDLFHFYIFLMDLPDQLFNSFNIVN